LRLGTDLSHRHYITLMGSLSLQHSQDPETNFSYSLELSVRSSAGKDAAWTVRVLRRLLRLVLAGLVLKDQSDDRITCSRCASCAPCTCRMRLSTNTAPLPGLTISRSSVRGVFSENYDEYQGLMTLIICRILDTCITSSTGPSDSTPQEA